MQKYVDSEILHFNPLPRKEGDLRDSGILGTKIDFNPLPRKEGDANAKEFTRQYMDISIHSLVKRETGGHDNINRFERNFNPLPRKEGDSKSR